MFRRGSGRERFLGEHRVTEICFGYGDPRIQIARGVYGYKLYVPGMWSLMRLRNALTHLELKERLAVRYIMDTHVAVGIKILKEGKSGSDVSKG